MAGVARRGVPGWAAEGRGAETPPGSSHGAGGEVDRVETPDSRARTSVGKMCRQHRLAPSVVEELPLRKSGGCSSPWSPVGMTVQYLQNRDASSWTRELSQPVRESNERCLLRSCISTFSPAFKPRKSLMA